MVDFDFHDDLIFNVTLSSGSFSGKQTHSEIPSWAAWFFSAFLLLISLIGLPLNGTTVMIFWRRKKLRHLVNFVLLLDCISHIVLCLTCIPIHVVSVWMPSKEYEETSSMVLLIMQQVVGNFANMCGLLLTLSIAILRYRRLCWKKKDKFSTTNAIKWSVTSGSVAIGFAVVQSGTCLLAHPPLAALTFYSIKLALILLCVLAIFFCYILVAQRVWSSGANQEKVMDASKLKKSRSVHMRATFHSCVQIVLVVATLAPYLYVETLDAFEDPNSAGSTDANGNGNNHQQPRNRDRRHKYINSHNSIDRLLSITINYTLLILGTPLAYIASCHRFREQFMSILLIFGHAPSDDDQESYLNNNNKFTHKTGTPGQTQTQTHQHHLLPNLAHHLRKYQQSTVSNQRELRTDSHICHDHKNKKSSIHLQNNNNFLPLRHNVTRPGQSNSSKPKLANYPSVREKERDSKKVEEPIYSNIINCNYSYDTNRSGPRISVDSIEYNLQNNVRNSDEKEGEISRASLGRSISQNNNKISCPLMDAQYMRPSNLIPATPVSLSKASCSSSSASSSTSDHSSDISPNSLRKLSQGFQGSSASSVSSHNTTTTTGTGTLTSSSDSTGAIATSICIPFDSAVSTMCQYQDHTTVVNDPAPCSPEDSFCQHDQSFGQNV